MPYRINRLLCDKCNKCKDSCDKCAIEKENEMYTINQYLCTECGKCEKDCPMKAIELVYWHSLLGDDLFKQKKK